MITNGAGIEKQEDGQNGQNGADRKNGVGLGLMRWREEERRWMEKVGKIRTAGTCVLGDVVMSVLSVVF